MLFHDVINLLYQYSLLGYRIDLYVHGYTLPVEIDEYGQSGRNISDEIE